MLVTTGLQITWSIIGWNCEYPPLFGLYYTIPDYVSTYNITTVGWAKLLLFFIIIVIVIVVVIFVLRPVGKGRHTPK